MQFIENYTSNHPRLLNILHLLGLAAPSSQTLAMEFEVIKKYAAGKRMAVEVGSYQGVSAAIIARQLNPDGKLYCVDPWVANGGIENHTLTIAKRHLKRCRVVDKVIICQGVIHDVKSMLPKNVDFAFIDGDHSYDGLRANWDVLSGRVIKGGVVCLHDTSIPATEPNLTHGSVQFFRDVIMDDKRYKLLECVHSLNVIQRN